MRPALCRGLTRRLILAALAAAGTGAASAQPPAPASVPAELRPYVPSNLGAYFVGFLTSPATPHPISRELFIRHQSYIRAQFAAGTYHLAGPLTDGGRIHGIVIVSAPTQAAALALISADPAVREGGFAVEVHPAMFPDLSAVRIEYPPPH